MKKECGNCKYVLRLKILPTISNYYCIHPDYKNNSDHCEEGLVFKFESCNNFHGHNIKPRTIELYHHFPNTGKYSQINALFYDIENEIKHEKQERFCMVCGKILSLHQIFTCNNKYCKKIRNNHVAIERMLNEIVSLKKTKIP